MLLGKVPMERWSFISNKISLMEGGINDCTQILYSLREEKSKWEIEMLKESGDINKGMFQAVEEYGGLGKTELEIASVADSVSRDLGFGGRIRMRLSLIHI